MWDADMFFTYEIPVKRNLFRQELTVHHRMVSSSLGSPQQPQSCDLSTSASMVVGL